MLPAVLLVVLATPAVDVREYGANPDDGVDDTAAIQQAIDEVGERGGGEVRVPAGEFTLMLPLYMRDNVQLIGDGYASHLKNARDKSTVSGDQRAIDFGNHTATTLLAEPTSPVSVLTEGSSSIATNAARRFPVGTVIFLSSTKLAGRIPWQFEFNEVMSNESNELRLKYPLSFSGRAVVRKPNGMQTDPLDRLRRVTKRVAIRNLRLSAVGDWWHAAGGCFEADISDLWIESRAVFVLNGFSRSRLRNVRASFDDRAVELGIGSHDSQLSGLDLWYTSRGNITTSEPLMAIGEGSHSITISDFNIDAGDHSGAYGLRFIMSADCTVRNGLIVTKNFSRGAQVAFSASTGFCLRNKCEGVEFRGDNATFALFDYGPDVQAEDNLLSSCRFFGQAKRAVYIVDGSRNHVRGSYFGSGSYDVTSNAKDSEITP